MPATSIEPNQEEQVKDDMVASPQKPLVDDDGGEQMKARDYLRSPNYYLLEEKNESNCRPLDSGANEMEMKMEMSPDYSPDGGGPVVHQPAPVIPVVKRAKEELDVANYSDCPDLPTKKQKIDSGDATSIQLSGDIANEYLTPVFDNSEILPPVSPVDSANRPCFITTPPALPQQQNLPIPSTSSSATISPDEKKRNKKFRRNLVKAFKAGASSVDFGPKNSSGKYKILSYDCMFPFCVKSFSNLELLTKHRIDVHNEKDLHCLFHCGRSFNDLSSMVGHIQDQKKHQELTYQKEWPCSSCDYKTEDAKLFVEHVYSAHQLCTVKCVYPNCHFIGRFYPEMEVHWEQFHGETVAHNNSKFIGPFLKCPVCDELRPSKESLNKHRAKVHQNVRQNQKPVESIYKCTFPNCHFEGKSGIEVVQHYPIHGGLLAVANRAPISSTLDSEQQSSSGQSYRIGSFTATEENGKIYITPVGDQVVELRAPESF